MTNVNSNGEGTGGCSSKVAPSTCCQPPDGKESSCCNLKSGSWGKGKRLISLIIIMAAIGVGATSLVSKTPTQPEASKPAASCPAQPQCGAATCTNPSVSENSTQSEGSKPASSCPTQSQCSPAAGAK